MIFHSAIQLKKKRIRLSLLKFLFHFQRNSFSLKILEISAKYNTIEIRIIYIIGNNSIQNKYNNKIIGK